MGPLREGLNRLPLRQRRLIAGRFELDYTFEQLGLIDGTTAEAARSALRRALLRLAEVMDDDDADDD